MNKEEVNKILKNLQQEVKILELKINVIEKGEYARRLGVINDGLESLAEMVKKTVDENKS